MSLFPELDDTPAKAKPKPPAEPKEKPYVEPPFSFEDCIVGVEDNVGLVLAQCITGDIARQRKRDMAEGLLRCLSLQMRHVERWIAGNPAEEPKPKGKK